MILLEASKSDAGSFQEAGIFAEQLERAGYPVCLNIASMPEDLDFATKFEIQPFLRKIDPADVTALIIIGAETLDDEKLVRLHQMNLQADVPITVIGQFEARQNEITTSTKLSYVTGQLPELINLAKIEGTFAGKSACPGFGVECGHRLPGFARDKTTVTLYAPNLADKAQLTAIQMLTTSHDMLPIIYTSGKAKAEWIKRFRPGHQVYNYSEISPTKLAAMSRILVLTDPVGSNYRAQCLLNNAIVSGQVIIDATQNGEYEDSELPILRGPSDLGYLRAYLEEVVIPNASGIGEENQQSNYARRIEIGNFLENLPIKPKAPTVAANKKPGVHFVPTNGVGLGHAQRCSLIADALPKKTTKSFLAFPSCIPMLGKKGYDAVPLVSRSALHTEPGTNDLVNFTRIGSTIKSGDTLVFDGGYIFDSVYRNILRYNLNAVWIRRGLWSEAQDNSVALDREKAFSRVIVPQEAFHDLNASYSNGTHVHSVGPIVRLVDRKQTAAKTRKALEKRFGLKFDKLVVTMLGGGVASDLSAHSATTCNFAETRSDCLNLVVVWPGAVVSPSLYAWKNTRVVTTHHASILAAAADVCVSATGYNSFHESLYNGVPTIFVPQMADYMDDQSARANAAADNGLAAFVKSNRPTGLSRQLRQFLAGKSDEIRANLAAYDLPEPGNARAAELIAEITQ